MGNSKLEFVLDQLSRYSGVKKPVNSASTFISCPYHKENTPSFRIYHSPTTRSPGYGHCYGCGAQHPWDVWAPQVGLQAYANAKPVEMFSRKFIEELQEQLADEELIYSPLPENKIWRTLKTNFLIEVGCQIVRKPEYKTRFVFMPVNILGEQRGYIRARMKKEEGKPSYINKKGSWSRSYGLFPFDFALRTKPKTVVLVEGPRDSLRLNYYGIPTMSILGTQSWSEKKATLLDVGGVEKVILAMDGDDAGKKAVELIRPSLDKLMDVDVFDLCGKDSPYWKYRKEESPSKAAKADGVSLWDPGNMPIEKIKELKSLWKKSNA